MRLKYHEVFFELLKRTSSTPRFSGVHSCLVYTGGWYSNFFPVQARKFNSSFLSPRWDA